MDAGAMRELLVLDWAEVVNTPEADRKPTLLERWHQRVQRLAEHQGLPSSALGEVLKDEASRLAERQRRHQLLEMARDLAVARALGHATSPPWRRRLCRLATVSGLGDGELESYVERLAERVRVVVHGAV